ncbi:unnamed protein product [Dovyalis caffra]|uniref:Uncharacterized protein n=1 Tax=Dovyalis caffra TaxID=77055 RepID=A0AAV1RI95_9ROSI|nr:unnamed protein product [Dovyalis caffra]
MGEGAVRLRVLALKPIAPSCEPGGFARHVGTLLVVRTAEIGTKADGTNIQGGRLARYPSTLLGYRWTMSVKGYYEAAMKKAGGVGYCEAMTSKVGGQWLRKGVAARGVELVWDEKGLYYSEEKVS